MSLSAAVSESRELPIRVQCVSHQSRDPHLTALDGQQLTVTQLYDSTFLLASPIHNGTLHSHSVQAVCPSCVRILLLLAGTPEWGKLQYRHVLSDRPSLCRTRIFLKLK